MDSIVMTRKFQISSKIINTIIFTCLPDAKYVYCWDKYTIWQAKRIYLFVERESPWTDCVIVLVHAKYVLIMTKIVKKPILIYNEQKTQEIQNVQNQFVWMRLRNTAKPNGYNRFLSSRGHMLIHVIWANAAK